MYKVWYRDLKGNEYSLRREYGDLIAAQSAADDYKIGEPCFDFWVEPVQSPIEISLDKPHDSLISNL